MFKNVIGQENQKTLLRSMADANRVPHALLLLAKEGSGALPLAQAFIQYLLCEDKIEHDACGKCKSCAKTQKLIHPDIHYSYPVFGSKIATDFIVQWRTAILENPYQNVQQWLTAISNGENKQGNINKDECLSIIKKLSLKSFESPHKILLMWLPEYLGKEGNRLLKLIEEPPENTIFILVAENQDAILSTILSRCQLVKLPPLNHNEIKDALVNNYGLPAEKAASVSLLADGNFSEAIFLAQHSENDNSALFLEWMRKCYNGNGVDLIQLAEKIASWSRETQKFFLRYGLHFIREYTILKAGVDESKVRLQSAELESARKMTKIIDIQQVTPISDALGNAIAAIERNGNGKIIFADTSIQLHKILRQTI
ncbi:MAG: ATP-binding protein [Saprospiraceae bacterium]